MNYQHNIQYWLELLPDYRVEEWRFVPVPLSIIKCETRISPYCETERDLLYWVMGYVEGQIQNR